MWSFLVDLMKAEARQHPHLFVMMALASAMILGYSYRVFAQQVYVNEKFNLLTEVQEDRAEMVDSRLQGLESRIGRVETTIDQRFYEGRLANVETEMFQLERLASGSKATDRDLARLAALRIEKGDIMRKLDEIARGVYH